MRRTTWGPTSSARRRFTTSRSSSAGSAPSPISAPPWARSRQPIPGSSTMPFEPLNPPQFPTPIAPYSAGAKAGNTVYVSGVLALGEGGTVLHVGDAAAQTRHVLEVIKTTLEAAGATMADVAMNHIFLKDLAD